MAIPEVASAIGIKLAKASSHMDTTYLSIADLATVTGGQDINFDQNPDAAVAQVNNRMAVCRTLGAEANRLNPGGGRLRETAASLAFKTQAEKCWASLQK
jgi:hypothetical protein